VQYPHTDASHRRLHLHSALIWNGVNGGGGRPSSAGCGRGEGFRRGRVAGRVVMDRWRVGGARRGVYVFKRISKEIGKPADDRRGSNGSGAYPVGYPRAACER